MKFFRKAWEAMDTFDRVVCVGLSAFGFSSCVAMAAFMAHSWVQRVEVVALAFVFAYWPWQQIPADLRRARIVASICGDNSGPRSVFCVLEPGHYGDHKYFRSNGGMIGWPNRCDDGR